MNYEVIFLESALEGLQEMVDYIVQEFKDVRAAETLRRKVMERVASLSTFPEASPVRLVRKGKELRIAHARKRAIIYSIDKAKRQVRIEAIIHGRRDIEAYMDDLYGENDTEK